MPSHFDWESEAGHDRIREIAKVVRAADEAFEREGGTSRHWVRDHFVPLLEGAGMTIAPMEAVRLISTPHDDPIVQACVDHGGHFWPTDGPEDKPQTCLRCWFNPGWKAGKPLAGEGRPVEDRPQA